MSDVDSLASNNWQQYPASAHVYPISPVQSVPKGSFDWTAFLIGLLVGVVIIILIVWLIYSQRALWFSSC